MTQIVPATPLSIKRQDIERAKRDGIITSCGVTPHTLQRTLGVPAAQCRNRSNHQQLPGGARRVAQEERVKTHCQKTIGIATKNMGNTAECSPYCVLFDTDWTDALKFIGNKPTQREAYCLTHTEMDSNGRFRSLRLTPFPLARRGA